MFHIYRRYILQDLLYYFVHLNYFYSPKEKEKTNTNKNIYSEREKKKFELGGVLDSVFFVNWNTLYTLYWTTNQLSLEVGSSH